MTAGEAVLAELDRLGLAFQLIDCDPALSDTEAFCAAYGFPLEQTVNTILVASKRGPDRHVACLLPGTTRLDVNGVVRRAMGVRKASFATAEETIRLTGMEVGGVTPLALPPDIDVLVDPLVLDPAWVVLGSGVRSSKLKVPRETVERLPRSTVVPGLALPRG